MATTNNTTTRNQFNFDAYNAVMKDANAGLKLFLVTQLLGDVAASAARYRSPLTNELMDLTEEASTVREKWKEISARIGRQTPVSQPNIQQGNDLPMFDANQFAPAIV